MDRGDFFSHATGECDCCAERAADEEIIRESKPEMGVFGAEGGFAVVSEILGDDLDDDEERLQEWIEEYGLPGAL